MLASGPFRISNHGKTTDRPTMISSLTVRSSLALYLVLLLEFDFAPPESRLLPVVDVGVLALSVESVASDASPFFASRLAGWPHSFDWQTAADWPAQFAATRSPQHRDPGHAGSWRRRKQLSGLSCFELRTAAKPGLPLICGLTDTEPNRASSCFGIVLVLPVFICPSCSAFCLSLSRESTSDRRNWLLGAKLPGESLKASLRSFSAVGKSPAKARRRARTSLASTESLSLSNLIAASEYCCASRKSLVCSSRQTPRAANSDRQPGHA